MLLLSTMAMAAICDAAIFSKIPQPALDASGGGINTGESTWEGKTMVGARIVRTSKYSVAAWAPVLKHGELQDEWLPSEFGYEEAAMLDYNHMYLRFDIGFLMNAVRVQRQIVVELQEGMVGSNYQTCWKMVDPTPYMTKLQGMMVEGMDWEKSSMGWWEVVPSGTGSVVTYQWWAELGAIPSSVMRYGASQTLPSLLAAFETRVGALSG